MRKTVFNPGQQSGRRIYPQHKHRPQKAACPVSGGKNIVPGKKALFAPCIPPFNTFAYPKTL
jgi:hypothetical protein